MELIQLVMKFLFVYFIFSWNKIYVFLFKILNVSLEKFFHVELIICPAGSGWSLIEFLISRSNLRKKPWCLVRSLQLLKVKLSRFDRQRLRRSDSCFLNLCLVCLRMTFFVAFFSVLDNFKILVSSLFYFIFFHIFRFLFHLFVMVCVMEKLLVSKND